MPRSSIPRNGERLLQPSRYPLQVRPGDLRVEERFEPLTVRARPQEHVLHQLARFPQPAVERESRLDGELLPDGRLVRVAEDALARLLEIAEGLPYLEPDQVLGSSLFRDRLPQ